MAQEIGTVSQRTPATTEGAQRMPSRPVFLPPADIYETNDSIVVMAEMPGVPSNGVDITLERRVLTIRGRSAANELLAISGFTTSTPTGITSAYLRCRKLLIATRSRRPLGTAYCIWFCREQNPQEHEGSSSKLREWQIRTAVRIGGDRADACSTGAARLPR